MYNPGYYKISKTKIKQIIGILKLDKDDIKNLKKNLKNTKSTLKSGDMQPARVISLNPLLISCYFDEFDAVLIYEYPQELITLYSLEMNTPLATSNSYWFKECFDVEPDIIPGNNCSPTFRDAITFVPLFLCKENQESNCSAAAKYLFAEAAWNHLDQLTKEYLEKKPNQYRKGFKTLIKY